MKAYVLHEIDDLRFEEISNPILKENEVLVEVKAVGICGSDIPRIFKTGTYSFPLIPGHEFSGVVVETGDDVDKKWKDKRVSIFPLIPCMLCTFCQKKQFELCRKYSYLGSRTNGGFAEYVAVPQQNIIELPDNVSFESAAMLEPMAVAVHGIRQVQPKEEDIVVVCGLGTIGMMLTMLLKEMGIKNVLVIGNKEFQRNKIFKLGVRSEQYCDSRLENVNSWIKEQTAENGADIFFECVGKNDTVNQAIENIAPNGKVQLIGNPASDINIEKNTYWKILRGQITIKGTWNSSFTHEETDDWHYVLRLLKDKKINPEQFITQKLSFDELVKGLYIMKEKKEEYIKIMIVKT